MHIVICGGGKIGEYLAKQMMARGHEVAVIEKDPDVATHLAEVLPRKAFIINGDGCDSNFQADADVAYADVFVATTGHDDENLVACEIARTVFKVPRAIARVNNPKNIRIFSACGIEPVSSTTIISQVIEEEAFESDVKTLSYLRRHDLVMSELTLPTNNRIFPRSGRKLSEFVLPKNAMIVAVGSDESIDTVDKDTVVYPGDTLIAFSRQNDVETLKQMFRVPVDQ